MDRAADQLSSCDAAVAGRLEVLVELQERVSSEREAVLAALADDLGAAASAYAEGIRDGYTAALQLVEARLTVARRSSYGVKETTS